MNIKPEACIAEGKLCLGDDYKMPLAVADPFVRKLQGLVAEMKRAEKRAKRKARAG